MRKHSRWKKRSYWAEGLSNVEDAEEVPIFQNPFEDDGERDEEIKRLLR